MYTVNWLGGGTNYQNRWWFNLCHVRNTFWYGWIAEAKINNFEIGWLVLNARGNRYKKGSVSKHKKNQSYHMNLFHKVILVSCKRTVSRVSIFFCTGDVRFDKMFAISETKPVEAVGFVFAYILYTIIYNISYNIQYITYTIYIIFHLYTIYNILYILYYTILYYM